MAHVGHFQVRPDYYPIVFLFFIISHSSGYFQHHSYEIISHGYQQKKIPKSSMPVVTSIIFISLLQEIQAWIFVGRWEGRTPRGAGREDWSSLHLYSTHLQQWRLSTLLCPRAPALHTSQEEPVVYGSWSSTSIPVSMPQLFLLLNKETLWSQIQRSICLQGWRELMVFEILDLECPV